METKIIEVTNGPNNWGKMLLGRFDEEWRRRSVPCPSPGGWQPLLSACGWGRNVLLVLDLQTGEGAIFSPNGYARGDLEKHKVWVCPLFEPFLAWLYQQELSDLQALPDHVDLEDAPFMMSGYRRPGPEVQLSSRVAGMMLRNGVGWRWMAAASDEEVLALRNCGPGALREVRELLARWGPALLQEALVRWGESRTGWRWLVERLRESEGG